MELKRNYLTSEELNFVLTEVSKRESAFDREMVKVGVVAQILSDDFKDLETCNDVYDKVMENGIDFNSSVVNYAKIDEIYNETHSTTVIIKEVLDSLSEKIDNMNITESLSTAIEQLGTISANK